MSISTGVGVGTDGASNRPESSATDDPVFTDQLLMVVGDHPIRALLKPLAEWLCDGADLVSLLAFKWRLLGAFRSPAQLWLVAPDPARMYDAVSKVVTLRPAGVETVGHQPSPHRIAQLRNEAETVLIPPTAKQSVADRFLEGVGSALVDVSTIVITSEPPRKLATGPRLAVMAPTADDAYPTQLGSYQFGVFRGPMDPKETYLASLLDSAHVSATSGPEKEIDWGEFRGFEFDLTCEHFRLFNALLSVTVWLSCQLSGAKAWRAEFRDYELVRRLLRESRIATHESVLPPRIADFAEDLFHAVSDQQQTSQGIGDFPIQVDAAAEITGVVPTTARKYLRRLVKEGFMTSGDEKGNRSKRSYEGFRFKAYVKPPFEIVNPFLGLPDFSQSS